MALAPPILAFALLFFVPESPIHYIRQNCLEKAISSCKRLYGPNFDAQVHVMESKIEDNSKTGWLDIFQKPEVFKPFLIVVGLSFVQYFSGMTILRSYVVKIFNEVFKTSDNENTIIKDLPIPNQCNYNIDGKAYMAAILIGSVRLVASLMASKLMYHYRRRDMYFTSAILTIFSLTSFATCNYLIHEHELPYENELKWIALGSAGLLVFSVQFGVQTLPMLLSGELFPADVKPKCKALVRCIQCILLVSCLKVHKCYFKIYVIHM